MGNASDNDLVRTKKLVKNAIITVEAAPFSTWYNSWYGVQIGKGKDDGDKDKKEVKFGKNARKRHALRQKTRKLDDNIADQFKQGRLYACISSRPGQCGRADGYIIEGKELDHYKRKMAKKK